MASSENTEGHFSPPLPLLETSILARAWVVALVYQSHIDQASILNVA